MGSFQFPTVKEQHHPGPNQFSLNVKTFEADFETRGRDGGDKETRTEEIMRESCQTDIMNYLRQCVLL